MLKIKLTQEEFLSGFRKEDKLMPVVTAVIYFGADTWDGPLSLHQMIACEDENILQMIPDYKISADDAIFAFCFTWLINVLEMIS